MSKAHDLFNQLGLELEKGAETAYPATIAPRNSRLRYWASEVRDTIEFGVQLRSPADEFSTQELRDLEVFGFKTRPNGREMYLSFSPHEAERLARATIILLSKLGIGD